MMRRRLKVGCAVLGISGICCSALAAGTGERRSCVDLAIVVVDPAEVEWGYWVLGGAVHRFDTGVWRPTLGLGSDFTLPVTQFVGFPAGDGAWSGPRVIRVGRV